jgi:predicted RNA binding protein YcfA (HicA-like mRNA interferase family)
MGTRKVKDMKAALSKKGFREAKSHHSFFILYIGEKKTTIRTKFSHGVSEYGEDLLQKIAKQLKLSRKLLDDLLDCPLSYEDYIQILKENKAI